MPTNHLICELNSRVFHNYYLCHIGVNMKSRYCDEVHKQRLGIILIWYIFDNSCLFVWSTCDNPCLFVWSTVYAARQGMMAYNNNTMRNPLCIFYKDKEVFLRVFVECVRTDNSCANISAFSIPPICVTHCVLHTLRVLVGTETFVDYMYLYKGLVTAAFGSIKANGRVSVIPT